MKLLLDINSLHELLRQNESIETSFFKVISIFTSRKIEISVLDKCLDDFLWVFGTAESRIIQNQLKMNYLISMLDEVGINIIKADNSKPSIYQNLELKDFFSHLQIAYVRQQGYDGILTHNSYSFTHERLKIFTVDSFLSNYKFEKIYNSKFPVIVDYSSKINLYSPQKKVSSIVRFSRSNRLISSLDEFSSYVKLPYVEPEFFFRVAQDINHDVIYSLSNKIDHSVLGKKVVSMSDNFEISVYSWQKYSSGSYHNHDNCICATFVTSGTLTEEYSNPEKPYIVEYLNRYGKGCWNLVPLGTAHKLSNEDNELLTFVVFKLFVVGISV